MCKINSLTTTKKKKPQKKNSGFIDGCMRSTLIYILSHTPLLAYTRFWVWVNLHTAPRVTPIGGLGITESEWSRKVKELQSWTPSSSQESCHKSQQIIPEKYLDFDSSSSTDVRPSSKKMHYNFYPRVIFTSSIFIPTILRSSHSQHTHIKINHKLVIGYLVHNQLLKGKHKWFQATEINSE